MYFGCLVAFIAAPVVSYFQDSKFKCMDEVGILSIFVFSVLYWVCFGMESGFIGKTRRDAVQKMEISNDLLNAGGFIHRRNRQHISSVHTRKIMTEFRQPCT